MKGRRARNAINEIPKEDKTFTNEKEEIARELVNYLKNLLNERERIMNEEELRKNFDYKIPIDLANGLIEEVIAKEMKDICFAMNNNKAPS